VTEAWSGDHFQPEMGLLDSADREYTKKIFKAKVYATFEGGFFHVFMGKKIFKICLKIL
jgi:hypothetical protein